MPLINPLPSASTDLPVGFPKAWWAAACSTFPWQPSSCHLLRYGVSWEKFSLTPPSYFPASCCWYRIHSYGWSSYVIRQLFHEFWGTTMPHGWHPSIPENNFLNSPVSHSSMALQLSFPQSSNLQPCPYQ